MWAYFLLLQHVGIRHWDSVYLATQNCKINRKLSITAWNLQKTHLRGMVRYINPTLFLSFLIHILVTCHSSGFELFTLSSRQLHVHWHSLFPSLILGWLTCTIKNKCHWNTNTFVTKQIPIYLTHQNSSVVKCLPTDQRAASSNPNMCWASFHVSMVLCFTLISWFKMLYCLLHLNMENVHLLFQAHHSTPYTEKSV